MEKRGWKIVAIVAISLSVVLAILLIWYVVSVSIFVNNLVYFSPREIEQAFREEPKTQAVWAPWISGPYPNQFTQCNRNGEDCFVSVNCCNGQCLNRNWYGLGTCASAAYG